MEGGVARGCRLHFGPWGFSELAPSAAYFSGFVPEMSVLGGQYGHYVYQVINGRAVRKIVKTGVRRDDLIEIKSGLMPGDTIILNGQTKVLFPGIQVTDKGAIKPENIKY